VGEREGRNKITKLQETRNKQIPNNKIKNPNKPPLSHGGGESEREGWTSGYQQL
jgi:hypothetical protein